MTAREAPVTGERHPVDDAHYRPGLFVPWRRRFPWGGLLPPLVVWSGYYLWEHQWKPIAATALVTAVAVVMHCLGYIRGHEDGRKERRA